MEARLLRIIGKPCVAKDHIVYALSRYCGASDNCCKTQVT